MLVIIAKVSASQSEAVPLTTGQEKQATGQEKQATGQERQATGEGKESQAIEQE